MSGGGAKPGERRGGRQKGTGNKPHGPYDTPGDRAIVEAERKARQSGLTTKEGRQILSEFSNFCAGIAGAVQPLRTPEGIVWRHPAHESIFEKYMHKACLYGHWVAPYESPTFKAVHFMSQWHEKPSQTTIEAAAALVTDDMDEAEAARQYLIQVRGVA
jgi:hypothetical protein